MITRKLGTMLLICIINAVLFAASEATAVKVPSTRVTMKVPALMEDAQISAKKASTRRITAPIAAKDLDGRSAYINNQYIADEQTPPKAYNDTSPPLYQFLQEQMEHILATSLPGEYQLQDNQANIETLADVVDAGKETLHNEGYGVSALQSNIKSPELGYGSEVTETEDDVLVQDLYKQKKEKEENSFHVTMPTRPVLELPKPINIENKTPSMRPETQIKTTSNSNYFLEDKLPTAGYDNTHNVSGSQRAPAATKQDKPQILSEGGYGSQLQNHKSHTKPQKSSSPSKFTYVHENSTLTMRKRRITFKTIATSSQIISTPLADLLFKYSIGIAKPSLGSAVNLLESMQSSETTPKVCNGQLNPLSYNKPSSFGYVHRT